MLHLEFPLKKIVLSSCVQNPQMESTHHLAVQYINLQYQYTHISPIIKLLYFTRSNFLVLFNVFGAKYVNAINIPPRLTVYTYVTNFFYEFTYFPLKKVLCTNFANGIKTPSCRSVYINNSANGLILVFPTYLFTYYYHVLLSIVPWPFLALIPPHVFTISRC